MIKKIILASYLVVMSIFGVWYVRETLRSNSLFAENRWEAIDQQRVLRHPALAALWPHIYVDDAVVMGFQDKRYRFRFGFKDADIASILKRFEAAGLKQKKPSSGSEIAHLFLRTDDDLSPSWWSVSDKEPRCIWEAGEAPANPILSVVWVCDASATDIELLGQITEF